MFIAVSGVEGVASILHYSEIPLIILLGYLVTFW